VTSKNKLLALIAEAEELGLSAPTDVILELARKQAQSIADSLRVNISDLPTFTLTQRGLVPAPARDDLILFSNGWREFPNISVPMAFGGGGVTNHALLSNLDYAVAGHTGFQKSGATVTTPDINFTPSTPATLSGDVNDYDLGTNTWIRLSGGVVDRIISGIVARTDGHYMIITNVGTTNKISFLNESVSSSAANRIITCVAGTVELHPYESLFLMYDASSSRWREIIHA
jgi:hypothetical protein